MELCKNCHDWTGCGHSRFVVSKCAKCGKDNVACAVCEKIKNPPPK